MDDITLIMVGGFILIVLAVLWNALVAPKKKKEPENLFKHFIDQYGFTASADAKVFNGIFAKRSMQLQADPPAAFIPVPNPKGIQCVIEKGFSTITQGLVDTPVKGAEGITIKSNYPMLADQLLDERLIAKLRTKEQYSFELNEGLSLRCDVRRPKDFETLLTIGAELAAAIERLNYAYAP